MELSAEELRVLGCLLEKAATTPDNYPLSTNALTNACNQKSSRDPVVDYGDRMVTETMLLLRPAGLARTVTSGGRVEKHRHTLDEAWGLTEAQLAVLAVLMLRGPNSSGELKTRTERYVGFASPADVETVLHGLAERAEPLVANLGRASGQSQDRWTHLLGGEHSAPEATVSIVAGPAAQASVDGVSSASAPLSPTPVSPTPIVTASAEPSQVLEARVEALERRLARLEAELGLD